MLKTAGLAMVAVWACIYAAVIIYAIAAKRSWIDLFAAFSILLSIGMGLEMVQPLLGAAIITIYPLIMLFDGVTQVLARRTDRKKSSDKRSGSEHTENH